MIYTRFFTEHYDADGILRSADLHYPQNFNFSYDVLDPLAEQAPDKLALLWRDDKGAERRFTFAEMQRQSRKAAAVFQSWGLKKGDVLMVCLRCRYEYWYISLAAHRLGILLSPVFHLLSVEDLTYRLNEAKPKAFICLAEGDASQRVAAAAKETGVTALYSVGGKVDGFADFNAAVEAAEELTERIPTSAEEPILLYFTSGSTGRPKGVLHNHAFLLGTLMGARHMQGNGPESLHFATGNSAWEVVCGTKFYGQWLCESGIFVYDFERFHPEVLLRQLEDVRVTSIMAQPTVYQKLCDVGMDRYDLSSVTCLAVGGEKLTRELSERVFAQMGQRMNEGYAQSEAGLISGNSVSMGWKEGSVGRALPKYHIEILGEDGQFVPDDEPGELVIVADGGVHPVGLLMGYYQDEAATAALWDGNIFHSGDWVWRDEEGFLFYLGRMDGLIKSRGYRISPFEIENVLSRHPAVYECMAVGEEDEAFGQKICAYVTLAEGYEAGEALEDALIHFYNKDCAGHQKIRALHIVPALRRNSNGKLMRGQFAQK